MADIITQETVLQEFLPVINSNLTNTLDLVLQNGIYAAKSTIVTKGTRELNAPSSATAIEKDRIATDGSNTRKSARATVSNVCEVVDKFVSLSDTETVIEGNRLATEVSDAILEAKQDINLHIWGGSYSIADPRKMGNILKDTPSGQKISHLKAEMTKNIIVNAVNTAKKYAALNTIFGSYDAIQYIAGLLKASETRIQNDGSVSLDINKLTIGGQVLNVVLEENLTDSVVLGNKGLLEFYALNPLKQTGRTTDYMIGLEYTVLNRNPKAFYEITVTDLHA